MSEESTCDEAFIQMFENSVKTKRLTDCELLIEICEAFFDHEICTWKDALLNELMMRFEAAVRQKTTSGGFICDAKVLAGWSDDPHLEKEVETRLRVTQFFRVLFAARLSKEF